MGINHQDYEAPLPQASAVIIRSLARHVSNWRASASLPDWLAEHGVPGISGVDTRYLTRKLRDGGSQRAALSTCGTSPEELLERVRSWPGLDGSDMVQAVTCQKTHIWQEDAAQAWVSAQPNQTHELLHVVVYDYGAKRNILRHLSAYNLKLSIVPADTPAEVVLALNPHGVCLSNGPGDPQGLPYAIQAIQKLIDSGLPILGICLGHQLLGLALGGHTRRLKFGHHGSNHPVQDLRSKGVLVTAQNHNYYVEIESLDQDQVEVTHLSLNDGTLEGMRLRERPVMSVQFHPEAAPGPHDAHNLFGEFVSSVKQQAVQQQAVLALAGR